MNGKTHGVFSHGTEAVNGLTDHVEQTTFDLGTGWHLNGLAGIHNGHAPKKAFGAVHRNGADRVLAQMLLAFQDHSLTTGAVNVQGVKQFGERVAAFEGHIDDRADNLGDFAGRTHG